MKLEFESVYIIIYFWKPVNCCVTMTNYKLRSNKASVIRSIEINRLILSNAVYIWWLYVGLGELTVESLK